MQLRLFGPDRCRIAGIEGVGHLETAYVALQRLSYVRAVRCILAHEREGVDGRHVLAALPRVEENGAHVTGPGKVGESLLGLSRAYLGPRYVGLDQAAHQVVGRQSRHLRLPQVDAALVSPQREECPYCLQQIAVAQSGFPVRQGMFGHLFERHTCPDFHRRVVPARVALQADVLVGLGQQQEVEQGRIALGNPRDERVVVFSHSVSLYPFELLERHLVYGLVNIGRRNIGRG